MQQSPQLAQYVNTHPGETYEQMARNLARQRGIDLDGLIGQLKSL